MSQQTARIDAIIDAAITAEKIVGCHIIVVQGGTQTYQRTAGFADREAERPVKADTIFRLASLTKPIVCATALRLIEQGKLALDQPVTRWFPDFQPVLPNGDATEISLGQLITHTAGLHYLDPDPDAPYRRANVASGISGPIISIEQTLKRMATVPLLFAPGSAWHYSLATDVLGAIIARAEGTTLGQAVKTHITKPLDMADTGFALSDSSRLATAYADGQTRPDRMVGDHHIAAGPGRGTRLSPDRALEKDAYQSGGSGMIGTAPDFIKFLEMIRQGGTPILQGQTLDAALQNHVGALRQTIDPGYGFTHLSSAILIDPAATSSPCAKGSIGWGGVFGHTWFIDRQAELSALIMTNTAVEGSGGKFPDDIRNAIYG